MADQEERHTCGLLQDTGPAEKATKTIAEFCRERFLPYHTAAPNMRQQYDYTVRNHIVPYIGHWRISEASRETFYNLLVCAPAQCWMRARVPCRSSRKASTAVMVCFRPEFR